MRELSQEEAEGMAALEARVKALEDRNALVDKQAAERAALYSAMFEAAQVARIELPPRPA